MRLSSRRDRLGPNLPLFPVNGKTIITSKEALDLTAIPSRLLIIGGGVEGCEFAALVWWIGGTSRCGRTDADDSSDRRRRRDTPHDP